MNTLTGTEKKAIFSLSLIFAFRMLGLFMILPIFSLYAHALKHATPTLIGFALGAYGLTQALFQIPLSILSDRLGRKPIIFFGLFIFGLGSLIAAFSGSIYGIIIARAVQGAGAIGSVMLALTADITRVRNRTKAMAIIGMSIGGSFMLAMVLGPFLNHWIGLSGLFALMALFAMIGILIVYYLIPNPNASKVVTGTQPLSMLFKQVLKQPGLLYLDAGIFIQHAILTACFIVIPIILKTKLGLLSQQQWLFYLPILLLVALCVFPLIRWIEKKQRVKLALLMAIALLALSNILLGYMQYDLWAVTILIFCFFLGFTLLEAFLPSLVSKVAPAESKGAAMGVYSTAQFLGIFLGGSLGGGVFSYFNLHGVFWFCAILAILWFLITLKMKPKHILR